MKKRTLTECLRLNIKQNWSEGGFFEYMTKKDCLEACDEIDKLQAENEKMANALRWWIKVNKGAPNKNVWAEEALKGE